MNVLYADDIVVVASSEICLKRMIKNVETYCEVCSLKVNLYKSKIMFLEKVGNWEIRINFGIKMIDSK